MRMFLLLLTIGSALVVMILGFQWGWLGIDPDRRLYDGWVGVTGLLFAASFLPWGRWER